MATLCERWFEPKGIELHGRVYEWLGVVRFKRVWMKLFKPDPNNPAGNAYVLGSTSLAAAQAFELRSRRSEMIHFGGLALGIVFLLCAAIAGVSSLAIAGLVVFFANFHCFILQRYNRIRIRRLLRRRPGSL
ncbi:MAG: hypothetical protein KDC87_12670 [Planctomycetes bacterium]|nr:hypothetical protein [Planctomycetota bacterium]